MDILIALKQEEAKLQQRLKGIQGAIVALNGAHHALSSPRPVNLTGTHRKRTMSAAGRAKISKLTKQRWAKFRAEKAKKGK